jgi:gas vesicle protein
MEKLLPHILTLTQQIGEIQSTVKAIQEVQHENREVINATLEQARKTNGRVTSLEGTAILLTDISSKNSGLIKEAQDRISQRVSENKETNREIDELKKSLGLKIEDKKEVRTWFRDLVKVGLGGLVSIGAYKLFGTNIFK